MKPLELLLSRRAVLDAPDNDGDTPLHVSAVEGKVKFVKALLDAGARVDSLNKTPLPTRATLMLCASSSPAARS